MFNPITDQITDFSSISIFPPFQFPFSSTKIHFFRKNKNTHPHHMKIIVLKVVDNDPEIVKGINIDEAVTFKMPVNN